METASSIAGQSLLLLLQIVGPALATLIGLALLWLIHKITAKVGVQMSAAQDEQVLQIVAQGVSAAEEWGRKQAVKPTGSAKADMALKIVKDVLESKVYLEYGEQRLRSLIDGVVNQLRGESVPVAPAAPHQE